MSNDYDYYYNYYVAIFNNFLTQIKYILLFGLPSLILIGALAVIYGSDLWIIILLVLMVCLIIIALIVCTIYQIHIYRFKRRIEKDLKEKEIASLFKEIFKLPMNLSKKLFKFCLIITFFLWIFTIITGELSFVSKFISSFLIRVAIVTTIFTVFFFLNHRFIQKIY